jgi:transcription elongation factor Elf1
MSKLHYVFKAQSIHKFKYCPYCGKDFVYISDGDYMGMVQCLNCDQCDEELSFDILEERLVRFPKWIEQFKSSV